MTFFPPTAIDRKYFKVSDFHATDNKKGVRSHYHVVVDGETNENAVFFYSDPKPAFAHLKNHVCFQGGVQVDGQKDKGGCSCAVM